MGASDNCGGTKGGYGGSFGGLAAGLAAFASGRTSRFVLHGGSDASSVGGALRGGGGIASRGSFRMTIGIDEEADETLGSNCTGRSDDAEAAGTGADAPCGVSAEVA